MKDYQNGDNRRIYNQHIVQGATPHDARLLTMYESCRDSHTWQWGVHADHRCNAFWKLEDGDHIEFSWGADRIRSFKTYEEFKEFVETELAIARIKG